MQKHHYDAAMPSDTSTQARRKSNWIGVALWVLGLLAFAALWALLDTRVVNVVTYGLSRIEVPVTWLSRFPMVLVFGVVALIAYYRRRSEEGGARPCSGTVHTVDGMSPARAGLPLLGLPLIAVLWLWRGRPDYLTICVQVVLTGLAVSRLSMGVRGASSTRISGNASLAVLLVAIAATTAWHASTQYFYWRRLMFGYADIGLFTRELEHTLLWHDFADRFADTRMGYHCIPMFYLLAPFYALFRSPVFLMIVAPLALNLAAVPIHQLARDRSGSAGTGLLMGLAWLALPSLSRLPYANTYGFQSIYLAVPLIAWWISLALRGRWAASCVCLVLALLCEETVCGVAAGWGLYMALFSEHRRAGVVIMIISILYLLLATQLVIPYFATESSYSRLELFGELSPRVVLERLFRPRVGWYLLTLAAPLFIGLIRAPRLLLVVLPTLLLILLLKNQDYLNVKYWHQSSMLPPLFLAAVVGSTMGTRVKLPASAQGDTRGSQKSRNLLGAWSVPSCSGGRTVGLLVTVMLFHHVIGFSPFSQAGRLHGANEKLKTQDARMAAVYFVRSAYPRTAGRIVATERLAAHFCDYYSMAPVVALQAAVPEIRSRTPQTVTNPDAYVLDRSDGWDPVVRAGRIESVIRDAMARGYEVARQVESVIVLVRADATLNQ
ncbi:MAG: DUF2079 domain-containing protein [Phycisphaerales bacterium]|nr:MAG: DUF2079 domain-containing protein [Phycisphaerales bacterium]